MTPPSLLRTHNFERTTMREAVPLFGGLPDGSVSVCRRVHAALYLPHHHN